MALLDEGYWSRVLKGDGCWGWRGTKVPDGYGIFSVKGRTVYAHRASWTLHVGPIPAGMFVCHRCDNPPCSNPAHLFLGSNRDNVLDRDRKGRGFKPNGELSPTARFTERDVLAIRRLYADGITAKAIASIFGTHPRYVYRLTARKLWCHLPVLAGLLSTTAVSQQAGG